MLVVFEEGKGAQLGQNSVIGSETYVIRDINHDLFVQDNIWVTHMYGRLSWENALQHTFGKYFDRSMEQPENLASAIGSAARMFEGLSRAEPDGEFSHHQLASWCGYRDASYGRGYINFIADTFPELSGLRTHMEAAMPEKYQDAVARHRSARLRLASLCACLLCSEGGDAGLCLTQIAEVIIRVAYYLTVVAADVEIKLCRAGLVNVFERRGRRSFKRPNDLLDDLRFTNIGEAVVELFTGTSTGRLSLGTAAIVRGGLVFYLNILRNVTDRPEDVVCLRIIPGKIEVESGHSFSSLVDRAERLDDSSSGPIRVNDLSLLRIPARPGTDTSIPMSSIEAHVEESATGLAMSYFLKTSTGSCSLRPSLMTKFIDESNGLMHCSRNDFTPCPPLATPLPLLSLIVGIGDPSPAQMEAIGHSFLLRQVEGNAVARCMALKYIRRHAMGVGSDPSEADQRSSRGMSTKPLIRAQIRILQGDNCISCCLRAAMRFRKDDNDVHIVLS